MATQAVNLFRRIVTRNFKVYALKILSLALAFASSSLIILFALHEFRYDHFHKNYAEIFRVISRNKSDQHNGNRYSSRIGTKQYQLLTSIPKDSVKAARVSIMNGISLKATTHMIENQTIHAADADIAEIFSFELISGSVQNFRSDRDGALISASLAQRLFGSTKVKGMSIEAISTARGSIIAKVAGVYQDFPANAHESFNCFIRFDGGHLRALGFNADESGIYGRAHEYNLSVVEQKLNAGDGQFSYTLQPVADIYFGRRVVGEEAVHGDGYSVLILTCLTGFILILALSNYVILTTLSLPHRSKEIAIRKLAGTSQLDLLRGFFTESLAIVSVSFILGVAVLVIASEFIKPLLAIDVISLLTSGDLIFICTCFLSTLVISLGPVMLAIKFMRASPTGLLGGGTISFVKMKQALAVIQLGVSMLVLVFSLVMKRQISYSLVKEPGRNNDQIVYLDYPSDLTQGGIERLREGWRDSHPNIVDVLATSHLPHSIVSKEVNSPFYIVSIDPGFAHFFDLNLTRGKWFGPNSSDSSFVVNEAGWKIAQNDDDVLGVLDDINGRFNLPQKPVKFVRAETSQYNYLFIRVLEVDIRRTVGFLSATFNGAEIRFLDTKFNGWLRYQDRLNTVSNLLAIIGVILSCCAIYALSLSMVQEKMKQLAVHKVFGANAFNIALMLITHFGREVMLAVVIFAPVTYVLLSELLRNFAYATSFRWYDPAIPIFFSVMMIVVLSLVQAVRLNMRSVIHSLKN